MNGKPVTRKEALEAYEVLDECIHPRVQESLTVLAEYMGYMEELNHRLANHAAKAGKALEIGKADLIRFGWDKCAEHATSDPAEQKALKDAFPYENHNNTTNA